MAKSGKKRIHTQKSERFFELCGQLKMRRAVQDGAFDIADYEFMYGPDTGIAQLEHELADLILDRFSPWGSRVAFENKLKFWEDVGRKFSLSGDLLERKRELFNLNVEGAMMDLFEKGYRVTAQSVYDWILFNKKDTDAYLDPYKKIQRIIASRPEANRHYIAHADRAIYDPFNAKDTMRPS